MHFASDVRANALQVMFGTVIRSISFDTGKCQTLISWYDAVIKSSDVALQKIAKILWNRKAKLTE